MATAKLELINPYSHLRLKRRPTYDEIIGLIDENETLTGRLPDRTATFYKASPEGSFFDGADHLEILKEQQNRIHERQMRELLLRQNVRYNGNTFNVDRIQQQRRENTPPQPETPSSNDDMTDAGMQTELQRRATAFVNRQQQTGEAHQGLLSRSASSIMDGIFSLSPLSRTGSRPQTPALQMPQPKREQPEVINIASDVEDVSSGEMMTARESVPTFTDKKQETIYYSLRADNPDASKSDLDDAFEILDRFKNKTSGMLARNITEISEIYQTLIRTNFISQQTFSGFLRLVEQLNSTKGHTNKEEVRNEIGRHYAEHIYNKYIADMARRTGAQTKAMARARRTDTGAKSSKG